MALHRQQGCRPSKVQATASMTECVRRLSASIVVHATVCSAAQCAPVDTTSATITQPLPNRANTTANYTAFTESQGPIILCRSRGNEDPTNLRYAIGD